MKTWQRNLYILMAAQGLVMAAMSMVVPFLPLYLYDLGMTDPAQVQRWAGLIFGINFLSAFVMAPIWGGLADRYGRKIMILRSGYGMAIITALIAFATSPVHLLLLRFLNGTISGFVPASVALTATNTPREHVGYALGMLQAGGIAGSILGPFFGGILAEWIGIRHVFWLTGLLLALATAVVHLFVREIAKPDPRDNGASFRARAAVILHSPTLLLLFGTALVVQFAMMGPSPQMPLFVKELGAPGGYVSFFAGLVIAAAGAANLLSSPVLGRWSDRYGAHRVLIGASLAAALLTLPLAFVTNVWQLLVFRFLLGLAAGGLLPALHALVRKHAPAGMESTAFGYQTSAINLGNLLGPLSGGLLTGWIGFRGLFLVTASLLLGNALLLWAASRNMAAAQSNVTPQKEGRS
ncbi:MAG TPA: MFS transporter [Calditerricola sp.]